MAELRLAGRPASPGFAEGVLFHLVEQTSTRLVTNDPIREAADLRLAILQATQAIGSLADQAYGEAVDILSFQIAMLEDDALSEGAFTAIENGVAADRALFQRGRGDERHRRLPSQAGERTF